MAWMVIAGIVATVIMVGAGVAVILPPYFQEPSGPTVLLAFSFSSEFNMDSSCNHLAEYLRNNQLPAIVFFSGEIAEKYPECVRSFDEKIDIGSSTYHYVRLPAITDYSEQLNQVSKGKKAVDTAGHLDSRSFSAPFGRTDENIYSLLSRSGILADFSYTDRYHKYYQDKFIWFGITAYNATSISADPSFKISDNNEEKTILRVNFDNSVTIEELDEIVGKLKAEKAAFVNASTLTGMNLTIRGEK